MRSASCCNCSRRAVRAASSHSPGLAAMGGDESALTSAAAASHWRFRASAQRSASGWVSDMSSGKSVAGDGRGRAESRSSAHCDNACHALRSSSGVRSGAARRSPGSRREVARVCASNAAKRSTCAVSSPPRMACCSSPSVSARPPNNASACDCRSSCGFASASPLRPARSVSRWPARLPLSTVETYPGRSGCSVRVSYQLNQCPRWRSMRAIASSVARVRAISPVVVT
jgi:hypothetical protein